MCSFRVRGSVSYICSCMVTHFCDMFYVLVASHGVCVSCLVVVCVVTNGSFRVAVAVPRGVCRQSMFGIGPICALLFWSAFEVLCGIAVPLRILRKGMFRVGTFAVLLWGVLEMSL